jgi:hypothetical protein
VIAAETLRACTTPGAVLDLFRELGYPVQLVPIERESWSELGVDIGWGDETQLALMSRVPWCDLYIVAAAAHDDAAIARFCRSLQRRNSVVRSVVVAHAREPLQLSIHDLSARGEARRLDVELAHPSSHAVDRINLLAMREHADAPRLFDRALDRESLTRQFFERFRDAVASLRSALAAHCVGEEPEAVASHALLLLSRLLFLSFIQEKGWLAGERRFLIDSFERAERESRNYFTTVLQPLFFGCLNTPARDRTSDARALGAVPYLNGGLFEESPFELRNRELVLPNALFGAVLDDVFERFAFSVDERDAAGTHVDPEMLGKVFESLMAEEERAASGSFYTPKPIVDVLITRAMVEWLSEGDAAVSDALRTLLLGVASVASSVALPATSSSASSAEVLDPLLARQLLQRLQRVTVLDPACGSGAFLLSALGVIEQLTRGLSARAGVAMNGELRQQIVERSLFGVDIKPEAVRLCELRLWLAIVSNCALGIADVQPLPNLDRNILQGNSLLSPIDFLGDARLDLYRDWTAALRRQGELLGRYRNAPREERPALARTIRVNDQALARELLVRARGIDLCELEQLATSDIDLFGRARVEGAERIRELELRLASIHEQLRRVDRGELDFFSFDVHFAHIMAAGGFDVVAGNPPWVRLGRIDARARRMYADRYRLFRGDGGDAAFHQPDLSIAFVERALDLVAGSGVIALLLPSKIQNAAYAAPLRRALQRQTIVAIDDWSDDAHPLFDADTFPLGITVARREPLQQLVTVQSGGTQFAMRQSELAVTNAGGEWSLVPPRVERILRELRSRFAPLHETLARQPVMGVKTGANRAFFLASGELRDGHLMVSEEVAIPLSALCRCVRGRDLRRWRADDSVWMLWPPANGWSVAPEWLRRHAEMMQMEPRQFRLAYVRPEHAGIKVAWKDVSRGLCAAVLPESVTIAGHTIPLVPNQTLYSLDATSLDEAYALTAVLNSSPLNALALSVAERAKDAHFRYFARTIAHLPLPPLDLDDSRWKMLVRIARRATQEHANAGQAERISIAALDDSVAALYGINTSDLEELRRFVARRLRTTAHGEASDD